MRIAIPIHPGVKHDARIINTQYLRFLQRAKYEPVTINEFNSDEVLLAADGLLLPGGVDVDPMHYLVDNYASFSCHPHRDRFERKLIKLYREAGKPIFGICRGFQLLFWEYANGDELPSLFIPEGEDAERDERDEEVFQPKILQYLQHLKSHHTNGDRELARKNPIHTTYLNPAYLGGKGFKVPTNSMHHQGVVCEEEIRIGEDFNGLIVQGISGAEEGYVVEAFDIPAWNVRAVQWHPEEMMQIKLLQNFFGGQEEEEKKGKKGKKAEEIITTITREELEEMAEEAQDMEGYLLEG